MVYKILLRWYFIELWFTLTLHQQIKKRSYETNCSLPNNR